MSLDPNPRDPHSNSRSDSPSYASADPTTDLRRLLAGGQWDRAVDTGMPVRAVSGEWMVPIVVNLPYTMLASLEAEAQSEEIGDLVRAALVAAGHGTEDDIAGVRSDRYATPDERREIVGATRLR